MAVIWLLVRIRVFKKGWLVKSGIEVIRLNEKSTIDRASGGVNFKRDDILLLDALRYNKCLKVDKLSKFDSLLSDRSTF
jgi:hypothetical protein